MLKRIFGPTKEYNVIWRIEIKEELDETSEHNKLC
jgi:hypothetical protein